MKAAVVYESSFGNTQLVAEAIARELGAEVYGVDDPAPPLEELDLLVVGAPTHVHGLSSRRSRASACDSGATGAAGIGARGWLAELPKISGVAAAAFDTRLDKPTVLTGSAARGIARRLRRRGCRLAAEPESFFVEGTPGPLVAGELERASAWARRMR